MKIKNNNKGFFILEALVSIVIFMIGILGVLKIQEDTIRSTSDSQYRISASYMASNVLSQIMIDKANITNYVDGSSTEYISWLADLQSNLPGVASNPPTIVTSVVGSGTLVQVSIFWQKPGDAVVSKYQTETTIY
ncbi:hypothetical protein GW796_06145 [archaeon]|nr:hypothetical protein [archaeon]